MSGDTHEHKSSKSRLDSWKYIFRGGGSMRCVATKSPHAVVMSGMSSSSTFKLRLMGRIHFGHFSLFVIVSPFDGSFTTNFFPSLSRSLLNRFACLCLRCVAWKSLEMSSFLTLHEIGNDTFFFQLQNTCVRGRAVRSKCHIMNYNNKWWLYTWCPNIYDLANV